MKERRGAANQRSRKGRRHKEGAGKARERGGKKGSGRAKWKGQVKGGGGGGGRTNKKGRTSKKKLGNCRVNRGLLGKDHHCERRWRQKEEKKVWSKRGPQRPKKELWKFSIYRGVTEGVIPRLKRMTETKKKTSGNVTLHEGKVELKGGRNVNCSAVGTKGKVESGWRKAHRCEKGCRHSKGPRGLPSQ